MAAYTWTVTNPNGHDGDMVVRQYSSFNLGSGNTLTPNNDCRGVMIWVDGDATINGTITVRGGYGGTPADTSWNMAINDNGNGATQTFTNSTSQWGNGSTDANGVHPDLTAIWAKLPQPSGTGRVFFTGQNGAGDATGGVGYGGSAGNNPQDNKNQGSPYSGGAGGNGDIGGGDSEVRYGGRGGNGQGGAYAMGAGAGNPGGGGNAAAGSYTGGLFVMFAKGNINGSGTINCNGSTGGYASFTNTEVLYAYGGGGSGGGRIILVAGGTISGSITTNVNGGSGGGASGSKYLSISGGRGNHGTVTKLAGVDQ